MIEYVQSFNYSEQYHIFIIIYFKIKLILNVSCITDIQQDFMYLQILLDKLIASAIKCHANFAALQNPI